jgi:hypothetical protein
MARAWPAAALVVGGLAGAAAVSAWPGAPRNRLATEQGAALRAEQDQATIQGLRGQLAAADAELAIERGARRALEDSLAALQVQASQLRDRLAFYDQLFPAGPAGTVSIRAIDIARVPSGLRYRVLLMRSARPGSPPFVGGLRFVATGTRGGEQLSLPLAPLQALPGSDAAAPAVASGAASATGGMAPTTAAVAADGPGTAVPGAPAATVDAPRAGAGARAATVESPPTGAGARAAAVDASQTPSGTAVPMVRPAASGDPAPADPMAAAEATAALVPLQVDQYRNSEGILALPADFIPAEVSVDVVQDGAVLASQQAAVAF